MKFKLLLLLLIIVWAPRLSAQTKLNFDGYYVTASDSLNPFRYYLRFYEDGTVIGCSTAGDPKNLLPWFKKENKVPSKGNYSFVDSTLNFTLKSEEGLVKYIGPAHARNWISLTVTSLINKYEGKEDYFFMRMQDLK